MPGSFTPEQRAFIQEVVREVTPEILRQHVESCPWGRRLMRVFWVGVGIGVGTGMLGGVSVAQILIKAAAR